MKKRKLLKFDIIHPTEYLNEKKKEWKDLDSISAAQYRERLIKMRSNYSDFYTWHLNVMDHWEAEEFFLLDDTYLEKIAKELFGKKYLLIKYKRGLSISKKGFDYSKWRLFVLDTYIKKFDPDVIFVRSHPIASSFWQQYREKAILVCRLAARLPYNWHPNDWDIIYTGQPLYKKFFEMHGVKTLINPQGFDKRVAKELKEGQKNDDVVFVGGFGTENFLNRTLFFNKVMKDVDNFKWWGYWWKYGGDGRTKEDFPTLNQSFQGLTSGLEMLQIFKDSAIVVNDYVDTANGIGFNQRMFEVMGCGGFMLTREAPNFENLFPEDIFGTYKDDEDLLKKIDYYRNNPELRAKIAANGKRFVDENYDYKEIVRDFEKDLQVAFKEKGLS